MNSKDKLSKIGYKIGEKLDSMAEKVNESDIKNNALNYGKKVLNKASKLIEDKKKEERCCASCGKKITSWRVKKIKDGELCHECAKKYKELIKEKKIAIECLTLSELNEKNNEYKAEKNKKQIYAILALVIFLVADFALLKITTKEEDHEGELQIPEISSVYYGNNVETVVDELKAYGFTNVQTMALEDLEESIPEKENMIDSITIGGSSDLNTNDWVKSDVEVCIYYHSLKNSDEVGSSTSETVESDSVEGKKEETDQAGSDTKKDTVYYYSKTKATVKDGNTGIYAYIKDDASYEIYYIIDFDEGYVYRFTVGNENEVVEKVKIESGTLNDVVIVTYHDGDDVWSEGLNFKWKNQPTKLIFQESDGYKSEFRPTNLNSALSIMKQLTIKEY